jgi:hypothetical protein
MIIATPDFGASANATCFLMVVWAVVLLFVAVGVFRAAKLLRSESSRTRKWGGCLLVVCSLIPTACCFGPEVVYRLVNGHFPLAGIPRISQGMSADEVRAMAGTPHSVSTRDDGESWYYWVDSFGIRWYCVRFGPDGTVDGTHGN